MNDELQPKLTWDERQKVVKEHASKALGELTAENFLAAAKDTGVVDELRDLAAWYTDAFDAEIVAQYEREPDAPGQVLQSLARQAVATKQPEKFLRYRELEGYLDRTNYVHAQTASAAHSTVVEQGLRYRIEV